MRDCEDFKKFIDMLRGRVRDYLPSEDVLSDQTKGDVRQINVRVGESEFTIIYRSTDAVKELMVRHEFTDSSMMKLLEMIGLRGIANTMAKWGYTSKSVTVSYVIPSKSLYLLVEGVRGRIPTIRVSIREDSYEASASYCVISEGENVCAYLRELIAILSELRKCVITYTR